MVSTFRLPARDFFLFLVFFFLKKKMGKDVCLCLFQTGLGRLTDSAGWWIVLKEAGQPVHWEKSSRFPCQNRNSTLEFSLPESGKVGSCLVVWCSLGKPVSVLGTWCCIFLGFWLPFLLHLVHLVRPLVWASGLGLWLGPLEWATG